MTQPKISVVIPAYNAAGYIHRAIESVMNQTYPALELIIVNDGSSDNTEQAVADLIKREHYEAKFTLVSQVNGGPGSARNHGVRLSSGDWIALLDSDDEWEPIKLERQIPYTTDDTIGVVQAWNPKECRQAPDYIDFEQLWKKNCVANSSVLIRRSAFEEVGGFDEDRAIIAVEDYNLWLRVAYAGWRIVTHKEELVKYHEAPGNLSSQLERATNAEFANLDSIANRLGIPSEKVEAKRIKLHDELSKYLLYHRCSQPARKLLKVLLQQKFTPNRFFWWLATYVPSSILNLRRSLPRKGSPSVAGGKS